jgi:transcriptional repressor
VHLGQNVGMADTRPQARDFGGSGPWVGLSDTQRAIVLALLRHGRLSRPEIMKLVGISPGSITRLTTPLVDNGILMARTERTACTGRPQSPLEVRADAESIIGVNLSGESLIAVLADLHLNVLATARRTLPGHAPADVVASLTDAAIELTRSRPDAPAPSCASVSLGAAATDERTVTDAVFLGWHRVPLAELVKTRLRMPTAVGNDLAAMTLQEAWFGAGREHDRLVLITVGAGIGFGLVVGGEVITTPDAELGLVGGIPVADDGRPATSLPAMDCLTSPAIERAWSGQGRPPLPAARVVDLAKRGEAAAVAICSSYARRVGRLIAMAAAFALPDVVVVAGERAEVAALFEDQVMVGTASLRRPDAAPIDIVVREHDRVSWARAAAALALRARAEGRL